MLKRKNLCAVLGVLGALALLLGGLGGASVVSAQEVTPETQYTATKGIGGWERALFGFGGGDWTLFDTVAEELGLMPEELFSELRAGKSLEEVAEERGVDLEAIREALDAVRDEAMRDAIAQVVEDGEITEDEADWRLEGLEQGYVSGRRLGRGMTGGPGRLAPDGIASGSA